MASPLSLVNAEGTVGGTLTTSAPGSTVIIQSWANGDNLVPALGPDPPVGSIGAVGGTPLGSVAAWTPEVSFGNRAFSSTGVGAFDNWAGDTFSLFAQISINFAGAGSVSFDENQKAVPEPASLLLLGSGWRALVFSPAGRGNAARSSSSRQPRMRAAAAWPPLADIRRSRDGRTIEFTSGSELPCRRVLSHPGIPLGAAGAGMLQDDSPAPGASTS